MGMDPLTIGLGLTAGSQILGAFTQNKANNKNYDAQQQAIAAQRARMGQVDAAVQPYLSNSQNPFAAQLMQMFSSGGFKAPGTTATSSYGAQGFDPSMIGARTTGAQGFNTGQDGLLQMLRSQRDPEFTKGLLGVGQSFNNSDLFSALAPLDQRQIDQQVAQLQGGYTTLGGRFGTAAMDKEQMLRTSALQNIQARNAGLASSSYEAAQGRMMQGLGLQAGREQNTMASWLQGMLANQQAMNQAGQFNAGAQNQAGQFNAGQANQMGQFNTTMGQGYNQFQAGLFGQAANMQAQTGGLNAQLLAIMAGQPNPGAAMVQPSAMPGALGDIGQMLMFLPFLQQMMGNKNQVPGTTPLLPPGYVPGQ